MTSVIFKCSDRQAAWQRDLDRAAEAQRYWRRTFQAPSQRTLEAMAQEAIIRNQHQGNRP